MALRIKALGAGSITATGTTTLYSAPDTTGQKKAAIVGSVIVCYNHTVSLTVKLWVKSGSTTGQIIPNTTMVDVGTNRVAVADRLTLAPGEKIEVNVSAAPYGGSFTYSVSGFERETGE